MLHTAYREQAVQSWPRVKAALSALDERELSISDREALLFASRHVDGLGNHDKFSSGVCITAVLLHVAKRGHVLKAEHLQIQRLSINVISRESEGSPAGWFAQVMPTPSVDGKGACLQGVDVSRINVVQIEEVLIGLPDCSEDSRALLC